jgi:hypothetical protein
MFEAGALRKSVTGGRVCPYLIDVTRRELTGPLSQFQAKEATKIQTWEMLQSINLAMAGDALTEARLERYFDTFWPTLETELAIISRELQGLPTTLLRQLMETLPHMFSSPKAAERYALYAGMPVVEIYWSQSLRDVCREPNTGGIEREEA